MSNDPHSSQGRPRRSAVSARVIDAEQEAAGAGGRAPTPRRRGGDAAAAEAHGLAESAAQEVGEILQRALERNPGASLADLNAVLRAATANYNARPQADLGGLSPVQVQRLLAWDWEGQESAVQLDGTLPPAALESSRTLHNARLLLALLGERGEVKATPKGNLPRATVAELRERMRWPADYRDLAGDARKIVNEEDVSLLHRTRILLQLAGLIKRRKGVFSLTRAGERLREERRVGELFATLFRTHFRVLNLAILDGVGPAPLFKRTIAFAIHRFGLVGEEWRTRAELKRLLLLPVVRREVPPEERFDPLDIAIENRLLRPLEGFALAEMEVLPREPGNWREVHRYRKSALFDRFLHITLPG